jgi:hypothetical protein
MYCASCRLSFHPTDFAVLLWADEMAMLVALCYAGSEEIEIVREMLWKWFYCFLLILHHLFAFISAIVFSLLPIFGLF